jgi:GNAT superfamily N-acetyltransferase
MSQRRTSAQEYSVRSFLPGDVDEFLELHGRIFDPDYGREWFAWKYEENPYVDHVPIFVAEENGRLVGARPFFALEMSVDGRRRLALQPGDTMVHPDHRRRGIFTRMTETAIERYEDGEPSFFFNFPNPQSGAGYLKLGWEKVVERSTFYRVQNAGGLTDEASTAWRSLAGRALEPLVDGYNRLAKERLEPAADVSVVERDQIPVGTMSALATDRPGEGIHALQDERFSDWRFRNPAWEYTVYVAEVAGDPVAGMVVGASTGAERTAKVADVAPLPEAVPERVLETLLHRIVDEYADADLLAAPAVLPRSLLRKGGFRSDDRPPLSYVSSRTTHVVRSLTGEWVLDGLDLTDEANWRLTFCEQDTG